ncbi:MAG: rod shape-determining protein MreC [Candidatus Eisenbacteria bacterium]|nr:rod shape-determining protein MreC [Candidatus Eisenbacteria bacterium]
MPSRGAAQSARRRLVIWLICAGLSGLLLAMPTGFRSAIASGLEWSLFLPVRAVIGWGGRSLLLSVQNRRLTRELASERLEASRLRDAGRENQTLRRLLGLQARAAFDLQPGTVVGRSIDWRGEVLWVRFSGSVQPGSAVASPDGLVGRLARLDGSLGLVETLWHTRVAVSVRNRRSGEQGILRWDPSRPRELTIADIPVQADFRPGDPIVTSGMGEVFPKGIFVGTVLKGEDDPRNQLKLVRVRPLVRPGGITELVLLRERPPEGDATPLYPEPEPTAPGGTALPGEGAARP